MKHFKEGEINVYINSPDHMTKIAAMPIYGKKVQVGKNQEETQSEKDSHSNNRDGKN